MCCALTKHTQNFSTQNLKDLQKICKKMKKKYMQIKLFYWKFFKVQFFGVIFFTKLHFPFIIAL